MDEAVNIDPVHSHRNTFHDPSADFGRLPSQIGPTIEVYYSDEGAYYSTYINLSALRTSLERYVGEYGDRLRQLELEMNHVLHLVIYRLFNFPLKHVRDGNHPVDI